MKKRASADGSDAFSLVEVTIALGIASFCLLIAFGLLPIGMATNRDSIEQTTAASLSSSIVADLRSTPTGTTNSSSSPRYGVVFPAAGNASQVTSLFLTADGSTNSPSASSGSPLFRATITVATPATGRAASSGRVWITWPALADQNTNALPSHYSGSFITVVGLDRN